MTSNYKNSDICKWHRSNKKCRSSDRLYSLYYDTMCLVHRSGIPCQTDQISQTCQNGAKWTVLCCKLQLRQQSADSDVPSGLSERGGGGWGVQPPSPIRIEAVFSQHLKLLLLNIITSLCPYRVNMLRVNMQARITG